MAAPLAPQDTVITIKGDLVSKPYIDITLHLMKTFGVDVENQSYQRFVIRGNQHYRSRATTWLRAMPLRRPTSSRRAPLRAVR